MKAKYYNLRISMVFSLLAELQIYVECLVHTEISFAVLNTETKQGTVLENARFVILFQYFF